ncbi:MAG TPA: ABC transporter permease [Acetobacteraceae bacterium]|nr:ABC transporter permease [Acetobacteraceae bacterium]
MRTPFRLLILAIYLFLLAPLLFVVISSVGDAAMLAFPPRSLTLRWYRQISPELLDSLRVSLQAAAATTAITTVLGVWMALAIARGRGAFAGLLKAVSTAPLSVPHLAIGVALYQATMLSWDFSGVQLAGTFWGLVLGHSVIALPYVVRGTLAGQAHVDAQIEEAARSLGASPWRALLAVTLPAIRPGLVSGAFLAFLASFDDVPVALFMGGGENSTTFPLQVLASLEYSLKPDIMAISTLIIVVSLLLMAALDRLFGLERFLHGRSTG